MDLNEDKNLPFYRKLVLEGKAKTFFTELTKKTLKPLCFDLLVE
jgi:hypothetical protein